MCGSEPRPQAPETDGYRTRHVPDDASVYVNGGDEGGEGRSARSCERYAVECRSRSRGTTAGELGKCTGADAPVIRFHYRLMTRPGSARVNANERIYAFSFPQTVLVATQPGNLGVEQTKSLR